MVNGRNCHLNPFMGCAPFNMKNRVRPINYARLSIVKPQTHRSCVRLNETSALNYK